MSRVLKIVGALLLLLGITATVLYLWASAPVWPEASYRRLTIFAPRPAPPTDTLTVMTYNIGYLSGMTNNRPVARTAQLFEHNMAAALRLLAAADADIVGLQEIDLMAARSFDVNQLDTLGTYGGYHAAAMAVNWDERYVPFPYGLPSVNFGRVRSGQGVLSRYRIRAQERVVLERPPAPFFYDAFYIDRLAQVVDVEVGDQPVIVINVHLEAWDQPTRARQAAAVRALYEQYSRDFPVLLIGDFNAVLPRYRESPLITDEQRARLEGDQTTDILLGAEGIAEVFTEADYAADERATFTYSPDNPRVKIDHIFYNTDRFEVVGAYVVDGPDQPSDHRAVVARLVLKR